MKGDSLWYVGGISIVYELINLEALKFSLLNTLHIKISQIYKLACIANPLPPALIIRGNTKKMEFDEECSKQ